MKIMAKKVLILSSSPRRGGNSDRLCDRFMAGAQQAGHEVEKIFLKDRRIGYCTGCGACYGGAGPCPQKDDAAGVIGKMVEADVIVMATPVYFYTLSAQMKTLIDRRVDAMVAAGLLEEVGQLLESGLPREATALQAIGYKEFLGVLDGTATVEEAVAEVKLRSRQYAKRQLTWLRRNPDIHWIWWEKDRDFARALQVSTEILAAAGVF